MYATIAAPVTATGPGNTYVKKIAVDHLMVHPDRQRELHRAKVLKMFKAHGGFDEELAGLLDVTNSGDHPGFYWVMAGQHRLAVADMSGVKEVWCLVHPDLSPEDQAKFYLGSAMTTQPTPLESWKVRRTANDPNVLAIENVLDRYNVKVQTAPRTGQNRLTYNILAASALERAVRIGGLARLDTIVRISVTAYPENPPFFDWFLLGMEQFLWAYEQYPGFSVEELLKALKTIEPALLKRRGKYHSAEHNGSVGNVGVSIASARYYALAILEVYNKGKRKGALPLERVFAIRYSRMKEYNVLPQSVPTAVPSSAPLVPEKE